MILNLVITDHVVEQISEVVGRYDNEADSIGDRFLLEFNRALKLISQYPFAFRYRYKRTRLAPIFRFPYLLCYEIIGDEIVVSKLVHESEHPKKRCNRQK
jgi:hypothetical protein